MSLAEEVKQRLVSCLFCRWRRPDHRIVAQTEHWYARLDNVPATPGHMEIVPKWHVDSLFDLHPGDLAEAYELMHTARSVAQREHGPIDAWNIGINDGPAAGRSVHHLHIHLIPRRQGDQPDPRGGIRRGLPNGNPDDWARILEAQ